MTKDNEITVAMKALFFETQIYVRLMAFIYGVVTFYTGYTKIDLLNLLIVSGVVSMNFLIGYHDKWKKENTNITFNNLTLGCMFIVSFLIIGLINYSITWIDTFVMLVNGHASGNLCITIFMSVMAFLLITITTIPLSLIVLAERQLSNVDKK